METDVAVNEARVDDFFYRKLYLVTGGTGFLGLKLIPSLLASGAKVRAMARSPPGKGELISGVEYVTGSITDSEAVKKAAKGVDGIFHLAGIVIHSRLPQFQRTIYDTNVTGTMNVLKAARENNVKRIVYASTSGTIGCSATPTPISDGASYCMHVVGKWPYYASKVESELRATEYANKHGLEVIFMRPSVMLGPGDVRFRSTHTLLSFLDGKIPVVPPGGYSFVDIRDAAEAFKLAMKKGKPGEGYLLAASSPTIQEFFQIVSDLTGTPMPKIKLPKPLMVPLVKGIDLVNRKVLGKWNESLDPVKAEMSVHYWTITSDKARDELGWRTRDPMVTIKDTVNWIQSNRDKYAPTKPPRAKL